MPYTVEEFERDAARDLLSKLTPEQRLQGLSPKVILEHLSAQQRLQGLAPEQLLTHLSPDVLDYLRNHKPSQDERSTQAPEKQS